MKNYLFLSILFVGFIIIGGCSKDESNNDQISTSSSSKISIAGVVYDANKQPLSGVTVQLGSTTKVTNIYGFYALNNVSISEGRNVLKVSKDGYWSRQIGLQVKSGQKINYNLQLDLQQFNNTVSSVSGGTITISGCSITFPSAAFVNSNGTAFNGTAYIAVKPLYTSDPRFFATVPGGDMLAIDQTGAEKVLYSYGMVGVELHDMSGNTLQLAPGKTASISLPIAANQSASAPASLPMWYFDETTGKWKEEGTATKQGANYVGTVSHFTWWNCDYPGDKAFIEGYVKDCVGNPVSGAFVYANASFSLMTDYKGYYHGIVPVGMSLQLYASAQNINSPVLNFTATTTGVTYTLTDFIIPCTGSGFIAGKAEGCQGEPVDGYITFYTGGLDPRTLTIVNGNFSGLAPAGTNVDYFITTSSGYSYSQVQITNFPDTTQLNLVTCTSGTTTTGDTLFAINFICPGLGFINVVENELSYTIDPDILQNQYNISTVSMVDTTFNFHGLLINQQGTYSDSLMLGFNFEINNKLYTLFADSGAITITHVDNVLQEYEFSYSGNCWIQGDSINQHTAVNFTYRLNH